MAIILPSLLNHTQEWHEIVTDSLQDQFSGINRLIETGICDTCSTLAGSFPLQPHQEKIAEEIITLLADHAQHLPASRGEKSVQSYQSHVTHFLQEAEQMDVQLLAQRIERLRKDFYHVTCHNQIEIRQLISARAQIESLKPVVQFCFSVEQLANSPFSNPRKLCELANQAKEFSCLTLKAYTIAKEQLQKLTEPPKLPQPEPNPALTISLHKKTWRQIVDTGREKSYSYAIAFFKILFFPVRSLLKYS